jgi:anaerobic selenocysteine-containing dehydrogenase
MNVRPDLPAEIVPSTCWECSALCGSFLTIADGKVTKIAPNPAHPGSRGAFCVKGIRALPEWTYQEQRLRTPLRRVGARGSGAFAPVAWDDALDEMADGLARVREQHGPLAIAGAVSGAFFSRGLVMAQLTRALGTPNWLINQDLCGGCRGVTEKMTGLNIAGGEDIDNAACVMIVGRNPLIADPPQWMALKQAKARGARFLVIDPFQTSAAEMADLWLRPRPGTDGAIALAMTKVLIDENLYDRDDVANWCHGFDELASASAPARPNGPSSRPACRPREIVAAGADVRARAVLLHQRPRDRCGEQRRADVPRLLLPVRDQRQCRSRRRQPAGEAAGRLQDLFRHPVRSGLSPAARDRGAAHRRGAVPAVGRPARLPDGLPQPLRHRGDPDRPPYPVRALYASGVNIAVTYPDTARTIEALKSLDLYVVAAHTMTPTAAWADLVLPKTTTLEEEEINLNQKAPCVTYTGATDAARRRREVRPRHRGRPDRPAGRARRGRSEVPPWRTRAEFNDYLVRDSAIDIAALKQTGYAEFPYELRDFEAHPFATPSGRSSSCRRTWSATGTIRSPPTFRPPICARMPQRSRIIRSCCRPDCARRPSPLALSRAGMDEESVARSGRLPASRTAARSASRTRTGSGSRRPAARARAGSRRS